MDDRHSQKRDHDCSEFRVLIVDDDPNQLEGAARALRISNFNCKTTTDCSQAIALCRKAHYDAMITEVLFPEYDGGRFVNEILKLSSPPAVIVVTAETDHRLTKNLQRLGVTRVEYKPIDYQRLGAWLRQVLDERPPSKFHQRAHER